MRKHNVLYYIFLWDSQNKKLSLENAEQIRKILTTLLL